MDKGSGELKVSNGEWRVTYFLHFVCYFLFHENVLFIQINKFKIKVVQEIPSPTSSFFILFEDRKVSSWSSALHFQLFLSHSASKMSPSNLFSFSAALFSSYLLPFPASVSFPMGQLFASGGQSIGASASASVLLVNIQNGFPLGLTGCTCCARDSQESSPAPQFKSISSSVLSLLCGPTLTSVHDY